MSWWKFWNFWKSPKDKIKGLRLKQSLVDGNSLTIPGGVRVDIITDDKKVFATSFEVPIRVTIGDPLPFKNIVELLVLESWYCSFLPDGRLRQVDLQVKSEEKPSAKGTLNDPKRSTEGLFIQLK